MTVKDDNRMSKTSSLEVADAALKKLVPDLDIHIDYDESRNEHVVRVQLSDETIDKIDQTATDIIGEKTVRIIQRQQQIIIYKKFKQVEILESKEIKRFTD